MGIRDSVLIVSGWLLLCGASGWLVTAIAQVLPA